MLLNYFVNDYWSSALAGGSFISLVHNRAVHPCSILAQSRSSFHDRSEQMQRYSSTEDDEYNGYLIPKGMSQLLSHLYID